MFNTVGYQEARAAYLARVATVGPYRAAVEDTAQAILCVREGGLRRWQRQAIPGPATEIDQRYADAATLILEGDCY